MNYVLVDRIKKINDAVKEAESVVSELARRATTIGVLHLRHHNAMEEIKEALQYVGEVAERL